MILCRTYFAGDKKERQALMRGVNEQSCRIFSPLTDHPGERVQNKNTSLASFSSTVAHPELRVETARYAMKIPQTRQADKVGYIFISILMP